ncbi:hypothetical protein KKF04_02645, partial [Patescibacteria group bacterium]|nr:hypothetical protein [Patescibacteria group bacterium]
MKKNLSQQSQDEWRIRFKENDGVLIGSISLLIYRGSKCLDMEAIMDYEQVNKLMHKVVSCLLPNKNVILNVFAHGYSWLGVEKYSFFYRIKEMYVDLLLMLRFLFKIKNKKYESHINSVKFSFHKKAYGELEKQLDKDGLDLLSKDENGCATINLKNKIELMPKYLENLGLYMGAYDADWIFVLKNKFNNYDDFKKHMNFKALFQYFMTPGNACQKELSKMLDHFPMIGVLFENALSFATKSMNKKEIIEKLQKIADQYNLKVAE